VFQGLLWACGLGPLHQSGAPALCGLRIWILCGCAFEYYVVAGLEFCAAWAIRGFLYVVCKVVFAKIPMSCSRLCHHSQCMSVECVKCMWSRQWQSAMAYRPVISLFAHSLIHSVFRLSHSCWWSFAKWCFLWLAWDQSPPLPFHQLCHSLLCPWAPGPMILWSSPAEYMMRIWHLACKKFHNVQTSYSLEIVRAWKNQNIGKGNGSERADQEEGWKVLDKHDQPNTRKKMGNNCEVYTVELA